MTALNSTSSESTEDEVKFKLDSIAILCRYSYCSKHIAYMHIYMFEVDFGALSFAMVFAFDSASKSTSNI